MSVKLSTFSVSPVIPVLELNIGTADKTLSTQDASDVGILKVTAGASKNVIFPSAIEGKFLIVMNETPATYTVTVKVAGETGITVAADTIALLACVDGDFVSISTGVKGDTGAPGGLETLVANQPASVATTAEGIVTDFNTLLAALKTAGVMVDDA